MARMPKLQAKETVRNGVTYFEVSVPGMFSARKKRERRFFRDSREAEKFAARLRRDYHEGRRGTVADPVLAAQAVKAADILKPYGVDILQVAQAYVDRAKTMTRHDTFKRAYDAFLGAHDSGWSERYRGDMHRMAGWLPAWFMEMKLPDIHDADIARAIRERATGPTAIATRTRLVKAVIGGRGKRRKTARRMEDLLSLKQIASMFRAASPGPERWALAMLCFAGIRPEELTRLDWCDVGKEHVRVRPDVSKTGTERLIPVKPRLARLLRGRPAEGTCRPTDWKRRWSAIRKAGNLSLAQQDACRHAFASHFLVAFGEAATQAAMGHTAGSRTLHEHYRHAVAEDAGGRYFR